MRMVGEAQTTKMYDLIHDWIREASIHEINLRSRGGMVIVTPPPTTSQGVSRPVVGGHGGHGGRGGGCRGSADGNS